MSRAQDHGDHSQTGQTINVAPAQPQEFISLREIYDVMMEVKGLVVGLQAREVEREKTDSQRLVDRARVDADVETRLRQLERWKYAMPGSAIIALGSALSVIFRVGG